MAEHASPSKAEVLSWLTERNNWGRWGADDEAGAYNLITPAKRLEATALVRSGRPVSLSRPYPKTPGPHNPNPAQHYMRWFERGSGGAVVDYYGFIYHGFTTTHVDALCHIWDENGMWQGRDPAEEITSGGARFGDITAWREGIVTRGVLIDVPKFRGEPYVTLDRPVQGWELEEAAAAQGVEVTAGDALLVYSGREAYQADHPDDYLGAPPNPGLHASCSKFVRDHDVAVLGWDMMDAGPNEYDIPWPMHHVLYAYGVTLLDNALLQPLAEACAEENRYAFLLMVLPLRVEGGTGSPVNPIAMF